MSSRPLLLFLDRLAAQLILRILKCPKLEQQLNKDSFQPSRIVTNFGFNINQQMLIIDRLIWEMLCLAILGGNSRGHVMMHGWQWRWHCEIYKVKSLDPHLIVACRTLAVPARARWTQRVKFCKKQEKIGLTKPWLPFSEDYYAAQFDTNCREFVRRALYALV